ncbi:MAG: hypothetical protein RLZZ171_2371, partial [Cyanobacteriota bacterium]
VAIAFHLNVKFVAQHRMILIPPISEGTRLSSASESIVLRIEVENNRFLS